MSDNLDRSVSITTEEPEIAATLSDLRYLVFQGMKGDKGDSAYEEAVELGFVGTEAEWIASLKGETGANGRDGQDGAPGTPGRDGVSPTVQTEPITGGNRVTITDAAHPTGQTFDVMDGVDGEDYVLTPQDKQEIADQAAAAAPVQSVNGRTGSVTVNEVPAVGGTDNKKVLTADNGTYSWAAVPTGETTKRISLYKNSQTGVYTCSMTATQLHDALPNVVLSTEDYRVPLSAYAIDKTGVYVKAVFIDDRRESNSAIVWTLSAESSSDLVAVSRDEYSIEALPDYSLTTGGEVLKITQYGPRWGENIPSEAASLRLLYDGAFDQSDPDLMLQANLANLETGAAICGAIVSGTIGSAALVDVTSSNDVKVYDLYAYDYANDIVVFARTEGALIRTATLSGSTKAAPVFGTLPLGGLPTVSASDNGKFLRVVSGAWAAATIPAAESNNF